MAGLVYKLRAKTGTYTDSSGNTKNRYAFVGAVFKKDDGSMAAKLESIPVGFDGMLYFADPEPRDQGGQRPQGGNTQGQGAQPSGDIPF